MKNTVISLMLYLFSAAAFSGCYQDDQLDGGPTECRSAAECDDSDPCTFDFCESGECAHHNTCEPPPDCESTADCDDADECTFDYCEAGECAHLDVCEEPECDSEVRTFALPSPAIALEAAAKNDMVVLAWQASSDDLTQSYVGVLPDEPGGINALELAPAEDQGAKHVKLAWPEESAQVFWSQWNGSEAHIMMAEFNTTDNSLDSTRVIYDEHHSSLGKVAYSPLGEFGLTWTDWATSGANPHSFFGRFSLAGEMIEAVELSEADYSYGPHLAPSLNGYSLIYTDLDMATDFSNAMMRTYDFSTGLSETRPLNVESSRFVAAATVATANNEIMLWFHQMHDPIKLFNLSFMEGGEVRDTVLLDYTASGIDALGTIDRDDALVSWCSPALPESQSAVKAVRVTSSSITLVLYQEMGDTECRDTKLVQMDGQPAIFWLDTEANVSYRRLCY